MADFARHQQNQNQRLTFSDANRISSLSDRRLFEVLHSILISPATADPIVDGEAAYLSDDDVKVTYQSGDRSVGVQFQVATGIGFKFNAAPADANEPRFHLINVPSAFTVTANASDPTNDRIDRLFLKEKLVDANSVNVDVIDPATENISTQSLPQDKRYEYEHAYVAGTPAASPSPPAAPAGFTDADEVARWILRAGSGAFNPSDLTDERTLFSVRGAIDDNWYTDSGAADAYVLTEAGNTQPVSALFDGMEVRFRPDNANSGASTVNVSGLGAVDIKRPTGTTLIANDLRPGRDAHLRYDSASGDFFLQNPPDHDLSLKAESSSNTEATVESALAGSITIPPDGSWVIDVEEIVHAQINAAALGHTGVVKSVVSVDDGGGPAELAGGQFGDAGSGDDTHGATQGPVVVRDRITGATNSATYTFSTALTLSGAQAALAADDSAGNKRRHLLLVTAIRVGD